MSSSRINCGLEDSIMQYHFFVPDFCFRPLLQLLIWIFIRRPPSSKVLDSVTVKHMFSDRLASSGCRLWSLAAYYSRGVWTQRGRYIWFVTILCRAASRFVVSKRVQRAEVEATEDQRSYMQGKNPSVDTNAKYIWPFHHQYVFAFVT